MFFKEIRGYILAFVAFVLFVVFAVFFPAVAVILVIVGVLWAIIKTFDSNKESVYTNINKISSVSTENRISVYTDIDNASNTLRVVIEDPETKKKTKPIVLEIKNITSDAGIAKEYFQDKNIEIVQSKTTSGYEFEVTVKNSSLLEWE